MVVDEEGYLGCYRRRLKNSKNIIVFRESEGRRVRVKLLFYQLRERNNFKKCEMEERVKSFGSIKENDWSLDVYVLQNNNKPTNFIRKIGYVHAVAVRSKQAD